ncbi:MAG: hypothetical protein ACLFR1_09415 [Spirochaetia bacterium]
MKKNLVFFLIFISMFYSASGQTNSENTLQQLPNGFNNIELGMGIETVRTLLSEDPLFAYRGDPDVSMLPDSARSLIETQGRQYLDRAFFQFNEDLLYIIILVLDRDRISFYSMYRALAEKYGEPDTVGPEEMVWINDDVRMSLERNLQIKYVDLDVFQELRDQGRMEESLQEISRENFLNLF